MECFQKIVLQGKTFLVTGGSGFVGAWLCALLVSLGATVVSLRHRRSDPESAFELLGLSSKISTISVDITDFQQVSKALDLVRPEFVFHLAACSTVTECEAAPLRAFLTNLMGSLNVVESLRHLRSVIAFLFMSTDHVFGAGLSDNDIPVPENRQVACEAPRAAYDASKAAAELAVRSMYATYRQELPYFCFARAANAVGMGDTNQRRVLRLFIQSALERGVVPLAARMNARQFISVSDLVTGLILALCRGQELTPKVSPSGREEITNFHFAIERYRGASEPFIRMRDLAEVVSSITAARVEEVVECVDFMPNENEVQALDCSATWERLGWRPMQTLESVVAELVPFYRSEATHEDRKRLANEALLRAVNRFEM